MIGKGCLVPWRLSVENIWVCDVIVGFTSTIHQPKRRHWIACTLYFLSIQPQQSWNVFFLKKENFTLYITIFFFSLEHKFYFFFLNMSLKSKFYSTTAREITLKRGGGMQSKQKNRVSGPACLVSCDLSGDTPPFLHPSSGGCPLTRAEQGGCLANKGGR